MGGLETVDYYFINDLVEGSQYLRELWEQEWCKGAMTAALHWGKKQDRLNAERVERMKRRGVLVEVRSLF